MDMERNVGGMEKNLRLAVGMAAVLVGLFAGLRRGVRMGMVSLGAIQMTTALSGYCPVNQMLGRSSAAQSLPRAAESALEQAQHFAE